MERADHSQYDPSYAKRVAAAASALAVAAILGYGTAKLEDGQPRHQTVQEQIGDHRFRFTTSATLHNQSASQVLLQGELECPPYAMDADVSFSPESNVGPEAAADFNARFSVRCNAIGSPDDSAVTRFDAAAALAGLFDRNLTTF